MFQRLTRFALSVGILALLSACMVTPEAKIKAQLPPKQTHVEVDENLARRLENMTLLVSNKIGKSFGFGSGVIIERKGDHYLAITAKHVVHPKWVAEHKDRATVECRVYHTQFIEGLKFSVVATSKHDLALISFKFKGDLPVAKLATQSRRLERLYGCGYQGCFGMLITEGILAAKGPRGFRRKSSAFWVATPPIMGGCSGGGLYNVKGELVGIRTNVWAESGKECQHYINAFYPYPVIKKFRGSLKFKD